MKNNLIFTLPFVFLVACAQQVDHANLSAHDRQGFGKGIAKRINEQCPLINGNFRVDHARFRGFDHAIVVTGTDLSAKYNEETNYEDYYYTEITGELNTYCTSSDFRHAREANIPFEYVYQDKDGKPLIEFIVNNSKCNESKNKNRTVSKVENKSTKTTSSTKERLVELNNLFDEGVITEAEFEEKRKSIFDEI